MTTRTSCITLLSFLSIVTVSHSQSEIIETIDEARQHYLQKNLAEAINSLNQALELINQELLTQMESIFPMPLDNWKADAPSGQVTKTAYATSLISKRKYFKKGGGQSIEIELQTNAPRIATVKMVFVNPSMINQMGSDAKISTISDRTGIERYDPIDKFAELIFVPTASVLISIRGYEMKDTRAVAEYAEKLHWELLEEIFP